MQDEEQSPARRRVNLRRGRSGGGGFSASQSTHIESYRGREDEEPDEVDDAVDIDAASERIRNGMQPYAAPTTPQPNDEANAIRNRLNAVALAGSPTYTKEHRLKVVERLLQRGYGLDFIANQLGCSVSTIEKDRAAIKRQWRENAKSLSVDEMIGEGIAGYNEIEEMSMRIAGAAGQGPGAVPTPMRLAAMRTHLAAKADKTRFLTSAGVYDVLRFRRTDDGTDLSDVQLMMQRTRELMESVLSEEAEEKPAARKRLIRKPGGFKAFSNDDNDASSSANEVQEL